MVKIRAFLAPKCTKIVYHDVFWLHTLYVFGSSQFQKLLFSNLAKMAHFWLNRTCSVGGFTMCSTLLNKILQDLSSKIPPQKKFLGIAATTRSIGGQKAIFVKKMHFSGRKWHFFKKFILYKNVQWPKIQFFSASKIIFCCPIQS